jgi:hypothetical protein
VPLRQSLRRKFTILVARQFHVDVLCVQEYDSRDGRKKTLTMDVLRALITFLVRRFICGI